MHLGYNIGGHIGIEGSFAIRGWNVLSEDSAAAWAWSVSPPAGSRCRAWSSRAASSTSRSSGGIDYFLMGSNGVIPAGQTDPTPNTGRGLDGMAFEFGATFELYPARWVSLGITPRLYELQPQRYFTDYNHRDTGGQTALDGNIGGSILSITLSVTFHFEPLPD